MDVVYSKHYNIDLGPLNYLHPYEGRKFGIVHDALKDNPEVHFIEPKAPTSLETIDQYLTSVMRHRVRDKDGVFEALEVPNIPFMPYEYLDRHVLAPMRWAVAGTMLGADKALESGGIFWNLAGGYHHAMPENMEGFCVYNDVGICHQQFIENGKLSPDDRILIIDTDAHHGNGNAHTFMENPQVTLLAIHNESIYPTSDYTRERVDISVPLPMWTDGQTYLRRFRDALDRLDDDYRLAFVIAGTDTLETDKLGGLSLSIEDVAERERLTVDALEQRSIPAVLLGGGGYSKDSATAVTRAISVCVEAGLGRSIAR